MHVILTRVNTSDQPIENATIVAEPAPADQDPSSAGARASDPAGFSA